MKKAAWSIRPSGFFAVHGHPARGGPQRSGTGTVIPTYHGWPEMSSPPGKFPAPDGSRPGASIASAPTLRAQPPPEGSLDAGGIMGETAAGKTPPTRFV